MIILRPREYTTWERVYLFEVARGMTVTMGHFLRNIWSALLHRTSSSPHEALAKRQGIISYEYPEQPVPVPPRARNVHRLLLNEKGEPKCVACLMCETICPAKCINIVARESDDPVKEKVCERFQIDELRCIFCGFCVEACPKDAIRMDTDRSTLIAFQREHFVFDREKLLSHKRRSDLPEEEGS